MNYLVLTSDKGYIDWNVHAAELKEEAAHIWELYKHGVIKILWFTEKKDAILIVDADSGEEAARVVDDFPLVKNGLIGYSINSLLPYTGFERMFDGAN